MSSADRVLVANAGASSLKLRFLDERNELLARRDLPAGDDPETALEEFLQGMPEPDAAGHRVVHGGIDFTEPVRVDLEMEERLERLSDLAPLHNPPALRAIRALHRLRPELPSVACFDTAFHATMSDAAARYALPAGWTQRWPLRRFGFHGLSYAYASRRAATVLDRSPEDLRLVIAHLGAGASLAAVAGGRSVDTTMGFTPLEGLVMATRSGSVDPGLLLWVQRHGGLGAEAVEQALDREAGLLGLSERSGDMREVLSGIEEGDKRCRLALAVYLHRLAAGIASMAASLGGLDALVFTGGVGENLPFIRAEAVGRLSFLGLEHDSDRNYAISGDGFISRRDARVAALVVASREELEICREVRRVLERAHQ